MIYTFRLPDDYDPKLIGCYDSNSGSSPHDFFMQGMLPGWYSPTVRFDMPPEMIDPIPSTNLPYEIFSNDLAHKIYGIVGEEIRLIKVPAYAENKQIDDFYIIYPVLKCHIWDMARSRWRPLKVPFWPKDKPMYYDDMVMKEDFQLESYIGRNGDLERMLVFRSAIRDVIVQSKSWVDVITPQNYKRA